MTGSFVHLIPKGFDSNSLIDPIHNPSVLEGFTAKPEIFSKSLSNLKRVCAELISNRTTVVSSAYWGNFVSCYSIVIPFINEFCRIEIAKISVPITKRYGEGGSPCHTPRPSVKKNQR